MRPFTRHVCGERRRRKYAEARSGAVPRAQACRAAVRVGAAYPGDRAFGIAVGRHFAAQPPPGLLQRGAFGFAGVLWHGILQGERLGKRAKKPLKGTSILCIEVTLLKTSLPGQTPHCI